MGYGSIVSIFDRLSIKTPLTNSTGSYLGFLATLAVIIISLVLLFLLSINTSKELIFNLNSYLHSFLKISTVQEMTSFWQWFSKIKKQENTLITLIFYTISTAMAIIMDPMLLIKWIWLHATLKYFLTPSIQWKSRIV